MLSGSESADGATGKFGFEVLSAIADDVDIDRIAHYFIDDSVLYGDDFKEVSRGQFRGGMSSLRKLLKVQDCLLDLGIGVEPYSL